MAGLDPSALAAGRRVGVFHPGTQHSWQTALAFQEAGRLGWYATSVFYDPRIWPYKIERFLPGRLGAAASRELRRRWTPSLDADLVRHFGFHEWAETAARRAGFHRFAHHANVWGNRAFAADVIHLLQREPVDAVIGYASAALEVFRWAKRQGLPCILDQPTIHPRTQNALTLAENSLHPEFFLEGVRPFDEDWIAQHDEEIALADMVLVGSDFSAQTLIDNGCPPDKLQVVSYGYDASLFPAARPSRDEAANGPLRLLYVGRIDARKGIAHLLEAIAEIPPEQASLTLVGKMDIPQAAFAPYAGRVRHIAQIPRSEVVGHFLAADGFVFPSLFEGGGIVLYEALAAGLGVIQSAAAARVVEDGRNGLILDSISARNLADAIDKATLSQERLAQWQAESWRLRDKHGWHLYRERLRTLVS